MLNWVLKILSTNVFFAPLEKLGLDEELDTRYIFTFFLHLSYFLLERLEALWYILRID